MIRVAQPGADLAGATHDLTADAVHYLTVVRRLGDGAAVEIFDGAGACRAGALISGAAGWQVRFTAPRAAEAARPAVTLCYALPKGDKLDRVVRQATEIGVAHVRLVAGARSVVRLSGDRARKRVARLVRVAQEAARQSGRASVPTIDGPVDLDAALAEPTTRLVLHPDGGQPIETLEVRAPLEVWVGPEGGFSPDELARLDAAGARRISLRCPVLRTETAAPLAVALALHCLGAL